MRYCLNFVFAPGLSSFGFSTFTAERGIKERGIRKFLGANITGITTLLSKVFLQLVAIACLIAFQAAGWIMHDSFEKKEYRITISGWLFLIAGISSVLIALLTMSF
jgi:hypothetical protein